MQAGRDGLPHSARRVLILAVALACVQCTGDTGRIQTGAAKTMARAPTADDSAAAQEAATPAIPDYWRDVKPVLDARCVTCHACSDAPCQLNLASYEGVTRGASKDKVYLSTRLRDAAPTRLFVDARSTAEWRAKGFYSVLDPNASSAAGAASASTGMMLDLLALKRQHPPTGAMPLDDRYELGADRPQQCPMPDEFGHFAKRFPQWGMPYGLPGLKDAEFNVLASWMAHGAPYREPEPLDAGYREQVGRWESFLNGSSAKQKLMSRYLFEHLFLASFYFGDRDHRQYFRFVRSRTPPGQAVAPIATRMPFNDPGSAEFWYRLEPIHATVVAKVHLPYELSAARMARFKQLFLDADFTVTVLPGYTPEVASNPFIAFKEMPVDSRYRFMLDDAEYFIRGFMKGPVCRGQVAVDVIDDRFWVVFRAPDPVFGMRSSAFLARAASALRLPAEGHDGPLGLVSWRSYRSSQMKYLMAKQRFLDETPADARIDLDLIWDGDGRNTNAALTIFRHFDNASVVRGLVGGPPKTAWVIDYSLFERIHYLLVAGFDVFGATGHQLSTRLYMDFLRMEGEFNFIALLPASERRKVRDYWYRDAHAAVREYVYGSQIAFNRDSNIRYTTGEPRVELMQLLRGKLGPVLERRYELDSDPDAVVRADLERLAKLRGGPVALLPEVSFLTVLDRPGAEIEARGVYTLVRDTAHANVASLFREEERLLPAEDELIVARGFVGAYPNALFRVTRAELASFVDAVARMLTEADYRTLVARFGVERTSASFWSHSDALARSFRQLEPIDAGVFDYGRLENR